ncbi:nucleoside hydrolase [Enterovibrio calviensis]|uniref:nucleoside hydrolase n=1 Tax=Enterovibrio calviensis TaxID=91359 RepID=UPI0037361312
MIEKQLRLWIDTDITIGLRDGFLQYKDVDDGYALGCLMHSPEVEILGISSTRGNTDNIEESTQTAQHFVSSFGANSYKVYKGATSNFVASDNTSDNNTEKENKQSDAVTALIENLEQGNLTILAIGALTNIADLIKTRPDLVSKIDSIVSVAGRQSTDEHFISGTFQLKPFRDLNFEFDTDAFNYVLKSGVSVVLVPFEVCKKMWVDFDDLARLRKQGPMGNFLARHALGWWTEWEIVFGSHKGFNPFDLVAAAYVVNPQWFTTKPLFARTEIAPSDTEKGTQKPYLICTDSPANAYPVSYCVDINEKAKSDVLTRLAKQTIAQQVLGLSHVNIIVEDVDVAADYYQRVLGFERAFDETGEAMSYRGISMKSFALDAGLEEQPVTIDVQFVRHPQAGIYLELMRYHQPTGKTQLPIQPKTYDLGGPRHIALEVANCNDVFHFLKEQDGVTMINTASDYKPVELDGFPITFFYWIDLYGVQWEMEEGRRMGKMLGIV